MAIIQQLARELARDADAERHHHEVKAIHSMGFLTYRCTSRCKTCTIWKRSNTEACPELSMNEWLIALGRLKKYGIRDFEVFGGDALLRDDAVFDVIKYCSDNDMETFFPTNSLKCDRLTVRRLVDAGLGTIYISLDDVGDVNDRIRGVKGAFDHVRATIEAFVAERGSRKKPSIIICTTLSRLNYLDFPKIIEFLDQYPVDAVYPRPLGEFREEFLELSRIDGNEPEPYFMPSDGETHLLDPKQFAELGRILANYRYRKKGVYVNLRAHYTATEETYTRGMYPIRPCHVATLLVTLNPNGDVVPCPFFRSYVIGNIVKEELDTIWGGEAHRRFLRHQQTGKLPICKNCNMRVYYPAFMEKVGYYFKRGVERVLDISNRKRRADDPR